MLLKCLYKHGAKCTASIFNPVWFQEKKSTNKLQRTASIFREGASATVIVWFSLFMISLRSIYQCKLQNEIYKYDDAHVTSIQERPSIKLLV